MRTLNFYIIKQIIVGLLVVTSTMLAIVWLTQSLRFLDMIITKGVSIGLFIKLTILLLPSFLVILMPIALFAVALFVYNRMSLDRELVIAHSTGLHPAKIAQPALLVGVAAMILAAVMTFKFVPESYVDFKELQWKIRNDISHMILQEGEFNTISKGLTVYVRKKDTTGMMYGLLIHDERDENKVTIIAENGALIEKDGMAKVIIGHGSRQEVNQKTGRFSVLYFDSYTMDFGDLSEKEGMRSRDVRELPLSELRKIADENNKANLALHKRFALPLYNITFVLLAVTFLIRGGFNRKGQTEKVLFSALLMLLIESAELGIENISLKKPYLVYLLYVNAVVPALLCLYILYAREPFKRCNDWFLRFKQRVKEWRVGKVLVSISAGRIARAKIKKIKSKQKGKSK